jgi:hypothetical protein
MPEAAPADGERQSGPDLVALAGVAVTVGLHLTLQARGPNPAFIFGACLGWAVFVAVRARRDRGALRRWGFRADNLARASIVPAALLAAGALGLAAWGYCHGTLRFPAHAAPLLLLYPIWGVAQQFLTLGLAVQNLELLPAVGRRKAALVLLGAALFAVVHAPDIWVMAATFLLELAVIPLFLRHRNLWPLGVMHGWLGGLFYLWGLGRDLWAENFG